MTRHLKLKSENLLTSTRPPRLKVSRRTSLLLPPPLLIKGVLLLRGRGGTTISERSERMKVGRGDNRQVN